MELTELVRTRRATPQRTWNIASSAHWYDGDDFWLAMTQEDSVYREAMIETEAQLLRGICRAPPTGWRGGAFVALGPGDGEKEKALHAALGTTLYMPIDVNETQLALATTGVPTATRPIRAEFRGGLAQVKDIAPKFVYLGSTYSNLDAMDYDLLAALDERLCPGDGMYLSVQTLPEMRDEPLLSAQYTNRWYDGVTRRMASMIGADVAGHFARFDPLTRNEQLGARVTNVIGTAREIGIRPGDTILTMLSHKPASLRPELDARFAGRYDIDSYTTARPVHAGGATYTSTFEGAILTKR